MKKCRHICDSCRWQENVQGEERQEKEKTGEKRKVIDRMQERAEDRKSD